MNGYPIVVFVEGEFECIVVCATTDIAHAWIQGARLAAKTCRSSDSPSFHAVLIGRPGFRAQAEVMLDGALADDDIAIDRAEVRRAVDALERAKTHAFPPFTTVVK